MSAMSVEREIMVSPAEKREFDAMIREPEYTENQSGDLVESRNYRRRYLRIIRKYSGCPYVSMHMVTSCSGMYTLVFGRGIK